MTLQWEKEKHYLRWGKRSNLSHCWSVLSQSLPLLVVRLSVWFTLPVVVVLAAGMRSVHFAPHNNSCFASSSFAQTHKLVPLWYSDTITKGFFVVVVTGCTFLRWADSLSLGLQYPQFSLWFILFTISTHKRKGSHGTAQISAYICRLFCATVNKTRIIRFDPFSSR